MGIPIGELPSGSIDISPILSKKEAERTDFEREIIAISSCHQADLFEAKDLYSPSPCLASVPKSRVEGRDSISLFADYRELLIDYYLKTKTPQLRELFKDGGLDTFIKLIATHSTAVRDIPELLKGLQDLFFIWKDAYNEKGLLLLSLPWLVLNNLAEADRERVRGGKGSILPPGEMEKFVGTV